MDKRADQRASPDGEPFRAASFPFGIEDRREETPERKTSQADPEKDEENLSKGLPPDFVDRPFLPSRPAAFAERGDPGEDSHDEINRALRGIAHSANRSGPTGNFSSTHPDWFAFRGAGDCKLLKR